MPDGGDAVPRAPMGGFIGNDPAVRDVLAIVRRVADTDATVLITGQTGTGKELIARELHDRSSRRTKAFVAVNCGALASTLLESEMFGHLRGAFTGASERRPGRFEAADGGTIFLDEIAEMEQALQVKLLRILQTGDYAPVGSSAAQRCDVRVVAATNQPLKPLVAAGRFRADLYYRLNVVCVDLPPLRERRADIPLLITHFISRFTAAYRRGTLGVAPEAERILLSYDYPGNARELENAIRRAVILCRSSEIQPDDLPVEMRDPDISPDATKQAIDFEGRSFHAARARIVDQFERAFLARVLEQCGGIVSRAARRAGLSERSFHVKLKKHGLSGRAFRVGSESPVLET